MGCGDVTNVGSHTGANEGERVAEKTNIAWCTSSWSPWIGCTEVSPGCDNCYARELDKRHRYGGAKRWGAGVPRYRTKQWDEPLKWNRKAAAGGQRWTVFPSLCDPFDKEVPVQWRRDFVRLISDTPNLTWLLLTKRIGNVLPMMRAIIDINDPLPSNVWLGASVVNQEEADRDIPKLLAAPAAKRFVSYEPALGQVDWRDPPNDMGEPRFSYLDRVDGTGPRIDWIILGGESSQGGAKARPFDLAWARSTVAQCKAAGIPVFCKQLGSHPIGCFGGPGSVVCQKCHARTDLMGGHLTDDECKNRSRHPVKLKDRAGADPAEWPEDLRIQQFPE